MRPASFNGRPGLSPPSNIPISCLSTTLARKPWKIRRLPIWSCHFCAEGSLASWLRQRGNPPRLSVQDITHLIEQAADALQNAHEHHVIHLDVKPSNFLLRSNTKNLNQPTLLLADFGIARNSTTIASSSLTIRGTPATMAPEQWSGTPVPATDQYAL